jgi:hypothetical protein
MFFRDPCGAPAGRLACETLSAGTAGRIWAGCLSTPVFRSLSPPARPSDHVLVGEFSAIEPVHQEEVGAAAVRAVEASTFGRDGRGER